MRAFAELHSFSMPLSPQASAPWAQDCRIVSNDAAGAEVGVVAVKVADSADVRGPVEDADERHRQPTVRGAGGPFLEGVEPSRGQGGDQRSDRADAFLAERVQGVG
jgi:hypothetical protein